VKRTRTQRQPYGGVALANGGAHHHQVGDVRAGDEQPQADRSGEHDKSESHAAGRHIADRDESNVTVDSPPIKGSH
jgi:hypothetical protein